MNRFEGVSPVIVDDLVEKGGVELLRKELLLNSDDLNHILRGQVVHKAAVFRLQNRLSVGVLHVVEAALEIPHTFCGLVSVLLLDLRQQIVAPLYKQETLFH